MTHISVERKASVWGFQFGEQKDFLRISMSLPTYVSPARSEGGRVTSHHVTPHPILSVQNKV